MARVDVCVCLFYDFMANLNENCNIYLPTKRAVLYLTILLKFIAPGK